MFNSVLAECICCTSEWAEFSVNYICNGWLMCAVLPIISYIVFWLFFWFPNNCYFPFLSIERRVCVRLTQFRSPVYLPLCVQSLTSAAAALPAEVDETKRYKSVRQHKPWELHRWARHAAAERRKAHEKLKAKQHQK